MNVCDTATGLFEREAAIQQKLADSLEGDVLRPALGIALNNVRSDMRQLYDSKEAEGVRYTLNAYAAAIVAIDSMRDDGWITPEQRTEQEGMVITQVHERGDWSNIQLALRLLQAERVEEEPTRAAATPLGATALGAVVDVDDSSIGVERSEREPTLVRIAVDTESGRMTIGERSVLIHKNHARDRTGTEERVALLKALSDWINEEGPGAQISPNELWHGTFGYEREFDGHKTSMFKSWCENHLTFRKKPIISHNSGRGTSSRYIAGKFRIELTIENEASPSGARIEATSAPLTTDNQAVNAAGEEGVMGYELGGVWRPTRRPTVDPEVGPLSYHEPNPQRTYSEKQLKVYEAAWDAIAEVWDELKVHFDSDTTRVKATRFYHLGPYNDTTVRGASEGSRINRDEKGITLREAMIIAITQKEKLLNAYGVKEHKRAINECIDEFIEDHFQQPQDET